MPTKIRCPICGKLVNQRDIEAHMRKEHGQ